ncbi:hypothetical protein ACFCZ1_21890 [Streptomyces sp. NPDC056224]|uniref:hypothetical protein n=1 Tax=Streptomyces sp. NPDC056224 TaxID=3345750 RepID=UPI0035DD70FA
MIAWDGRQFRLAAGHDLTYHHGLELVLREPVFISCPSSFHDPTFRAPSPAELRQLACQLGEKPENPSVVVAFEADADGQQPVPCPFAAERLNIVQETVPRYRGVAAPGQRFAPWVRLPSE